MAGKKLLGERRMSEAEDTKRARLKMERTAAQSAKIRARVARWDLDIAVFLFAVLIIVMILLFQKIGIEIVGPVAIFGLAMVWLVGWRRGKQLYQRFYEEELARMKSESKESVKKIVEEKVAVTVEDMVKKAFLKRLQQ
jgi:predicted membrane chloride channel (bestrophin family)